MRRPIPRAHLPGVTTEVGVSPPGGLAVLLPFRPGAGAVRPLGFSHWLAQIPPWLPALLLVGLVLSGGIAQAQGGRVTTVQAVDALFRWMPFLVFSGFLFNVLISFLAMLTGTLAGVLLGLGQISKSRWVQKPSWFITQLFRNSPWLVLLFIVMLSFPFEVSVFGLIVPIPDWIKAVIGLGLPIMANIAEIVRGAINSVPTAQWEAAESLAFTRRQTLWRIILPQCFKRMIPPWMNWYAILTMATPLVSILGVEEVLNLSRQAIEAEDNHPELLVPFYGFVMLIFFCYCYPIARMTVALERRFAVKL
ncbi:MAG: amino acid ABC transporter permease [Burkholderiaceae bacterium]